jgi:DNA repair exonuclease SbcCD ATPase subunit
MSDTPIMVNEQLENALECIADLERENKALREALTRTRGQWIHSVNMTLPYRPDLGDQCDHEGAPIMGNEQLEDAMERIEELEAKLEEARRLLHITWEWYVVNDYENNARSLRKRLEELFEEAL